MGRQRPAWPKEYYSILRKEVNFGCAVCGKPFPLQIHHIEGYEDGVVEKLERLIMLCQNHHQEADNGSIPQKELYIFKEIPFNRFSVQHSFKITSVKDFGIHIGSNVFYETPIPLEVHRIPIISIRIEDNVILLSAKFFDESDNLKLQIVDNFWEADTDVADVRYSEDFENNVAWISVKMKDSESYLNFKIKDNNAYINGKFYVKGNLFDVNENGVFVLNKDQLTMHGNVFRQCAVGIGIG